ncbi:Uncharacterized protein LW94_13176 [Fusarium fujikuroi]|nr:Uncharacterized protein Y057_9759 [Fusarium fujikuroi]KLP14923.1 Uncharacterized protein LW94_13176 [Fusarium fujikuroi]
MERDKIERVDPAKLVLALFKIKSDRSVIEMTDDIKLQFTIHQHIDAHALFELITEESEPGPATKKNQSDPAAVGANADSSDDESSTSQ